MHPTVRSALLIMDDYKKITDHAVNDRLLTWAKEKRKGLTKKQAAEQGLDLYAEIDAEAVLEKMLESRLIAVLDITERGRELQLTSEGRLALVEQLTGNFSPAYKSYEEELHQLLSEAGQLHPSKMTIMRFFSSGYEPADVLRFYTEERTSKKISTEYHEHLMKDVAAISSDEETFIFHLAPQLYVPADLIGMKVKLVVEGFGEAINLPVSCPFPNKRYYVAGMKSGRLNTASGFYPIAAKKGDFPVFKEFTLRWLIDDTICIEHRIEVDFCFTTPIGRLFSTTQQFPCRLAKIPEFTLTTKIDREGLVDRNARLIVHDIYHHFELQESVTLTNFPIELHQFTRTGTYFDRWYRNWSDRKRA